MALGRRVTGHCDWTHMWVSRSVHLPWPYTQPLTIHYKVCERCGMVAT